MKAELIVAWLKEKLGDGRYDHAKPFWIEHDWCGDTQGGFHSEYEINYEALEVEMDAWIAATFPKDSL